MNMWCVHYPDHIALLSAVLVETFDDVLWCSDCRFFLVYVSVSLASLC